jgi:hypothetical protein
MTISPVTFVAAPPIKAVERVERITRRPKHQAKRGGSAAFDAQPLQPALSADSLASVETRDALIGIRLGG